MKTEHRVSMALVHYPVRTREGKQTAAAVTPISVHDLARVARTYDMEAFYVVTPLRSQQALLSRIKRHWSTGYGASYNPSRKEALELLRLVDSLNEAISDITVRHGCQPKLVATGASGRKSNIGFDELKRDIFEAKSPYLLLFGTSWGLDREIMDECDHILDPVMGLAGYNHLPVREAAAIIIDRLLGRRRENLE